MPEYLAPGVYVEETSFRSKSIEGVSTSTAAFIGPTRFGPTQGTPELVTSFAEYARIFGGPEQLQFGDDKMHNFTAHAVRNFFDEGGSRLYIARVFSPNDANDGFARAAIEMVAKVPASGDTKEVPAKSLNLQARHPGAMGNMRVTFNLRFGQNILSAQTDGAAVLRGVNNFDLVCLLTPPDGEQKKYDDLKSDKTKAAELKTLLDNWAKADGPLKDALQFRWPERKPDGSMILRAANPAATDKEKTLPDLKAAMAFVVTLSVSAAVMGPKGTPDSEQSWATLALHPAHPSALTRTFTAEPSDHATEIYVPLVATADAGISAEMLITKLIEQAHLPADLAATLMMGGSPSETGYPFSVTLTNGNDGVRPSDYQGAEDPENGQKNGFLAMEDVEDISIVAAPGSTYKYTGDWKPRADTIQRLLIAHCERMRYRIAVLDSVEDHLVSDVRKYRAQLDSRHAALYYPWLRVLDPVTGEQIHLPPSGFVAGIYARNDTENGVHKAPANETVRTALGLKLPLSKAHQDVLNPEGINCFRTFEGRGLRLWGARTISSDPEWKYVNLRRYFAYLEHSVEKGTQWVVFNNNDDGLWAKVRQTVEDFLYAEWRNGHVMGTTPSEAYFVKCDRSTMTQNDLDNGRLVCLIGVSPVRPAEFVIFQVGQWTASKA